MTRSRGPAYAAMLELLERRHGVGARGTRWPAWMELRLDRALDALADSERIDFDAAVQRVQNDAALLGEIADLLRVGETSFYRDPPQWDALAGYLPRFAARERVRALSAGCSTGEEAWTLAMLLADSAAAKRAAYRVVGVDRSEVALATAREGVYPTPCARSVPTALAGRYLHVEQESVRVADELRPGVSFVPRDVMLGPPPGHYEVIVCKNVLIYFGDEAGEHAVQLLLRSLADDGVLIVARSEVPRLRRMGHKAVEIADGVTVFRA